MPRQRLVMISGSGPGAGKSTLAARLRVELEAARVPVRLLPESATFEGTELGDLADRFRRHDHPSADDLLAAFDHLAGRIGTDETWIQDWSWIDLAEDLAWARDLDALRDFSRRLHRRAVDLAPYVLYLRTDITTALARAVHQRGERWLARTQEALTSRTDLRTAMADLTAVYANREVRLRAALEAGGWPVADLVVDADADQVLEAALAVLRPDLGVASGSL